MTAEEDTLRAAITKAILDADDEAYTRDQPSASLDETVDAVMAVLDAGYQIAPVAKSGGAS